jgi:hypothetical protein
VSLRILEGRSVFYEEKMRFRPVPTDLVRALDIEPEMEQVWLEHFDGELWYMALLAGLLVLIPTLSILSLNVEGPEAQLSLLLPSLRRAEISNSAQADPMLSFHV